MSDTISLKEMQERLNTLDLSEDTISEEPAEIFGDDQVERSFRGDNHLMRTCSCGCREDDDFPVMTDEGRSKITKKVLDLFAGHKVSVCVDEQEKGWFSVYVRKVE